MTADWRVHGRAPVRHRPTRTHRSGPVTTTTVIPAAYHTALRLARGDPARLRILNTTTVLVLNRPHTTVTYQRSRGVTTMPTPGTATT